MKHFIILLFAVSILLSLAVISYATDVPGGTYKVGEDIPAGSYSISVINKGTNLTVWGSKYQDYNADGGLLLNVTVDDKNPTLGKVVLEAGNVINFSAPLVFEDYVSLDFNQGKSNTILGGTYKVGEDIPAGSYSISVINNGTNLTVWGSKYQDYRTDGGVLLNVTVNDNNPTLGKVVLEAGNVINFSAPLVFEPYGSHTQNSQKFDTAQPDMKITNPTIGNDESSQGEDQTALEVDPDEESLVENVVITEPATLSADAGTLWFDTGIGSVLPKPISADGKELETSKPIINDEKQFFCHVNGATESEYNEYIEELISIGFNSDVQRDAISFAASDDDGHLINIVYFGSAGFSIDIKTQQPGRKASASINDENEPEATTISHAEGFFPKTSELFGRSMPSLALIIGREPDEAISDSNGLNQIFHQFTYREYRTWGTYLARCECSIDSQAISDKVFTCNIKKENASLLFTYDGSSHSCILQYPIGTRPETEISVGDSDLDSILPEIDHQIGTPFPSISGILSEDEYTVTVLDDGRTKYCYSGITEEQYHLFSRYLSSCGCKIVSSTIEDKCITSVLELRDSMFEFEYNCVTLDGCLIYPDLFFIVESPNEELDTIGILPDGKSIFDHFAPSISKAIGWAPNKTENNSINGYIEIYYMFSADDYNLVSNYLQSKGCSIVSSSLTNQDVSFVLKKGEIVFTFTYDRIEETATVQYPYGSYLEPTGPLNLNTRERPSFVELSGPSTVASNSSYYSPTECYEIASRYLLSRPWKNPSSVSIIDYTVVGGPDNYTYYINYSAQNGFGGYNRETYIIAVDFRTGTVVSAYSN